MGGKSNTSNLFGQCKSQNGLIGQMSGRYGSVKFKFNFMYILKGLMSSEVFVKMVVKTVEKNVTVSGKKWDYGNFCVSLVETRIW